MADEVIEGGEIEESVALLNGTVENVTMTERLSHQFIYSVYARGVSGIFVWTALIVTSFQVWKEN